MNPTYWSDWDREFVRTYYRRFGVLIGKLIGKKPNAVRRFAVKNGLTVDADTHARRSWWAPGKKKRGAKHRQTGKRRREPSQAEIQEMAAEIRRQRGDGWDA